MLGRETWLMFSEETCQAHFELGKTDNGARSRVTKEKAGFQSK